MPSAHLDLRLLGLFRLSWKGQPVAGFDQARLQQLLAYLVLHRETPVSRQQLAFLFWPDSSDQQARNNLRTLLARLRRSLPAADDLLLVAPQTIQARPEASLSLDVAEFESAVARATEAQASGDAAVAAEAWSAAVALYAGELLPDCYDDWILPFREALHRAYGDALERLLLLLEEQRAYEPALAYGLRLLQHDPLHEPAYRHLMRLYLALGDRTEALRLYQACVKMLQSEFGVAPSRETREVHAALLRTPDHPESPMLGAGAVAQGADLPLIGRKAEWARMLELWRAAAAGSPQLLLLTGEAGIGKTRLAEELLDWVARQGVAAAAARCYPGAAALPYAPIAEWLSEPLFRTRLAALEDASCVEVARIVPALLAERPHLAPPGPLTEAWQRTRLFEALTRAVLGVVPSRGSVRLSGSGATPQPYPASRTVAAPLLLFLDDLQWVDRETLDWIGYALRYSPGAPLLIVSAVRQYDVGRDHPLTARRLELERAGLLTEIPLLPLDLTETALLAASAAGKALADTEAEQIYRDSEGFPLFVVEMVRAGASEAGTPTGDAAAELGPARWSAPWPVMPHRVRAMIQGRLALLSPASQAVLEAAAVIGRRFTFGVLASASDQPEAAVLRALDEAWQRRLVRTQGVDAYDFSHDGIRAVVYSDIGPGRRRALHLRVAQALEALHAADLDAFSGQIAAHYEKAGQVPQAIRAYRRAAGAAQRVYANEEAVRLYSRLLEEELGPGLSPRERCEIMLALAEVWRVTGRWSRARALIGEAKTIAEARGDALLSAQTQRALADVLHLLGYYEEALAELKQAEARFEAAEEWRGVISALWTMGQIHWFRGEHPEALAVLERQLQLATEIGDERGACEALETLGMVYWGQGDWDRSASCCLQSIVMAEPLDYKQIITRASITLGNVRASQHWFGEALHWYQRAGVLAGQIDDRRIVSWASSNIAMVLAKRGDYRRALAGYTRSLSNAWQIGDRWTACLNVAGLASVNERLGRLDLAESLYRNAIELGRSLGIPSYLSSMMVSMTRLLLAQQRALEARAFYGEALERIAGVAGERLAGEDTRFDARVLGIRLRCALAETLPAAAVEEVLGLLYQETAPHRRAALNYELWRLAPHDEGARAAAAAFYRSHYLETGDEESRNRCLELTGETLPDPPPLPDVSALIPDEPDDFDLATLLAELEASFDSAP